MLEAWGVLVAAPLSLAGLAISGIDDALDVDALSDDVVVVAVSASVSTTEAGWPLGAPASPKGGAPAAAAVCDDAR